MDFFEVTGGFRLVEPPAREVVVKDGYLPLPAKVAEQQMENIR
ncbi:MAG: hypothetical protein R6T98_06455 [Desulfatiglandales bacterium]